MVPSNIWRLAKDGEPNFFNIRMADFVGLTVDDLVRPGLSKLDALIDMAVHPDDRTSFRSALNQFAADGGRVHVTLSAPTLRWSLSLDVKSCRCVARPKR